MSDKATTPQGGYIAAPAVSEHWRYGLDLHSFHCLGNRGPEPDTPEYAGARLGTFDDPYRIRHVVEAIVLQ